MTWHEDARGTWGVAPGTARLGTRRGWAANFDPSCRTSGENCQLDRRPDGQEGVEVNRTKRRASISTRIHILWVFVWWIVLDWELKTFVTGWLRLRWHAVLTVCSLNCCRSRGIPHPGYITWPSTPYLVWLTVEKSGELHTFIVVSKHILWICFRSSCNLYYTF
jgi:hypothetical protein